MQVASTTASDAGNASTAREGRVHVVGEFASGKPSTKSALKALSGVTGKRVLAVLTRDEDLAWLSLRNLQHVHVLSVDQLNVYDVIVADDVVFSSAALDAFVASKPAGGQTESASSNQESEK